MNKKKPSLPHLFAFLLVFFFLSIAVIHKHIQRIKISYEMGKLKATKTALQERQKKLETIFARSTTPSLLLKRSKLLGLTLVFPKRRISKKDLKAVPGEGELDAQ